jgi:hypothetical protein
MTIKVGTLCRAKRKSAICDIGEVGVCYEVYSLDNRPGYSFIFEIGGYDGFSLDEVEVFLDIIGEYQLLNESSYRFANVVALYNDFVDGQFENAFREARKLAG